MTATVPGCELRPLELASGFVRGLDTTTEPLPDIRPGFTTVDALETIVLRALQRQPCGVTFSGGRDSSAILAVATRVARREGLPMPVPVTLRLPGAADSDETEWQEMVVRHLGLTDWERLRFDDELDIVGPFARRLLDEYGVQWPANVYTQLPLAERLGGGAMLTGFGGDELLSQDPLSRRANQVLARAVRPEPRDALRIVACTGPRPVRRAAMRRYLGRPDEPGWIRPAARRAIRDANAACLASEPLRWDRMIDRAWWRTRYRRLAVRSLDNVGAVHDVQVYNPFADPLLVAAIVREGGRTGFASRTAAMRTLVGDLLPEAVLSRSSKAVFTTAFFARHTRAFAREWDGRDVDPALVDPVALRTLWLGEAGPPDFRTGMLLQTAWLRAQTGPAA